MSKIRAALVLAAFLLLLPNLANAQCNSSTPLPTGTVLGRLLIGPGPCQAIPFPTLAANIGAVTATRNINTTAPLAGGGSLAADRTLSITGAAGQVLAGSPAAFTATPALTSLALSGCSMPGGAVLCAIGNITSTTGFVSPVMFGGINANSTLTLQSTTNGSPSGDAANLYGSTVTIGNANNAASIINLNGASGGGVTVNITAAGNGLNALNVFNGAGGKQVWVPGPGTGTTPGTINFPDGPDTLVARATTDTLTNKTISGASNTLTGLSLTTSVTGTLPIANGGTNGINAPQARASTGLNVDSFTGVGNTIYTILATDRTVGTNAAFTASRTWTLPAANAVNPGQEIIVADYQGTVTGTNTLVISRAGADTVNGVTSVTIAAANGAYLLKSDGVSKWTAQALGAAAAGGVSSVTCGTGLSGGTITTSGTCAVSLTTVTNSLGADVLLNSTSTYFDGPSTAQGTSGTWFASGCVSLNDSGAAVVSYYGKLWDGTTLISSAQVLPAASTGQVAQLCLSGVIATPAANIRISVRDSTATTGKMIFNGSGNSKDSTLTVVRIN
jgi:hypothetical protein